MNLLKRLGRAFGMTSCFNNEPKDRQDSFKWEGSLFWPKASAYRIVTRDHLYNKYHVQAFYNNNWIDVLEYDNGCDDEGQLTDAKWRPMGDMCHYEVPSLEYKIDRWLGKEETTKVLKEVYL